MLTGTKALIAWRHGSRGVTSKVGVGANFCSRDEWEIRLAFKQIACFGWKKNMHILLQLVCKSSAFLFFAGQHMFCVMDCPFLQGKFVVLWVNNLSKRMCVCVVSATDLTTSTCSQFVGLNRTNGLHSVCIPPSQHCVNIEQPMYRFATQIYVRNRSVTIAYRVLNRAVAAIAILSAPPAIHIKIPTLQNKTGYF